MSEQKRMGRDLTVGSVPKLLVAFASPLFLSNLLQAVYNMVDMIVVGKYVGSVGLSAVLMMIFGIILREPIMDALNTPDESRAEVRAYITVCMTGLVFIYGYNMEYIPIALLTFYSMSFRSCMSALINGSGNSRLNLCVAIFDGVIARIGLSYLFGHMLDFGYMGFWTGSEMASFVPFIVGGVYFVSGKWKKKSKLIED